MGSGCGTVDSVDAIDTRGPGFESCHRQLLLNNYLPTMVAAISPWFRLRLPSCGPGPYLKKKTIYLLLTVCRKDENKEKEARNGTLIICSSLPCSLFVRKLRFVVQGRVGFPAEAQ